MLGLWTRHLVDKTEADKFTDYLRHSRQIFDRANQLLNEFEARLGRSEMDETSYGTPNWAYRQAHKNGYRECLSHMKSIFNLDNKEPKL